MKPNPPNRRHELEDALRRDLTRHARRELGHRTFWQSLAMVGAVGWPIALGAVSGIWLGSWLDSWLGTGVVARLVCLAVGVSLGSWAAWRVISEVRK